MDGNVPQESLLFTFCINNLNFGNKKQLQNLQLVLHTEKDSNKLEKDINKFAEWENN